MKRDVVITKGKATLKYHLLGVLILAFLLSSCAPVLLREAYWPSFTPPQGKATCVIIRQFSGWSGGSNMFVPIYCDRKYVGGTVGSSVFSFQVEPGEHYIMADAANKSIAKFNFKAGKIYYISHTIVHVPYTRGASTLTPNTADYATTVLAGEKGKCVWVQPNPSKMKDDLSEKEFAEIRKSYDEWAADPANAGNYKIEKEYPGY